MAARSASAALAFSCLAFASFSFSCAASIDIVDDRPSATSSNCDCVISSPIASTTLSIAASSSDEGVNRSLIAVYAVANARAMLAAPSAAPTSNGIRSASATVSCALITRDAASSRVCAPSALLIKSSSITAPASRADALIFSRDCDPSRSMLTIATPSRPNKAAAVAARSVGCSISAILSATTPSASSRLIAVRSSAFRPNSSSAFLAAPVPISASPRRLEKRSMLDVNFS